MADWEYISEVKARAKIPILGNGDINSAATALRRLEETGCDGVMIGRGCLKNPRIFAEARGLLEERSFGPILERLHTHLAGFYDERLVLIQMRKFAAWYSAGYAGAAGFRKELFQLKERDEVLGRINEFFNSAGVQADTSHEAFLMGGHG